MGSVLKQITNSKIGGGGELQSVSTPELTDNTHSLSERKVRNGVVCFLLLCSCNYCFSCSW